MKICVVLPTFCQFQVDAPVVSTHNSHKAQIRVLQPSDETTSLIHKLGNRAPFTKAHQGVVTFFFVDDLPSLLEKLESPNWQVDDQRHIQATARPQGRCGMAALD